MPPASESEQEQEARILQAKAFYNKVKVEGGTRKLDAALHKFKEVSLRCPCNKTLLTSSRKVGLTIQDISPPTCHCKDFVSLATSRGEDDEDSLAMYRLATKPCDCGSGITPCKSPAHIAALDGMSAVCEAQKAYAKAIQYASLLLAISPHAPEGYLRIVKNLRLQARASKADATSQCMYILTQAAASVRTFGDKYHDKLKAIRQMLRTDPLRRFPVEVQQMVLEYLSYADLCRALRVSKAWNEACRNPGLWMHLEFVKRWRANKQRPFRPGVLNDIISNRAQNLVKSLTITGMKEFAVDATKLRSILRALPRLESLSLYGSNRIPWSKRKFPADTQNDEFLSFSNTFNAICEDAPRGLKVLRLDTFAYTDPQQPHRLSTSTIDHISESLVEMTLANIGQIPSQKIQRDILGSRVWPKLEKLTVKSDASWLYLSFPDICLRSLASNTPSLKDLTLHGYQSTSKHQDPKPCLTRWKNLERLSHGISQSRGFLAPLASPKLRSLELLANHVVTYHDIFNANLDVESSRVLLEKLEHFCCAKGSARRSEFIWSCDLESIRPSCTNGTLRSLHICFDLGIRSELEKFLNKPAIHTLSCEDIIVSDALDHFTVNCNSDAFLDWVDTFPNLHTVGAFPIYPKDIKAWIIIAKLLKRRPDIKTIYTNALFGTYRDELLERADEIGVKIIHADRVPEPVLKPLPSSQLTAGEDGTG